MVFLFLFGCARAPLVGALLKRSVLQGSAVSGLYIYVYVVVEAASNSRMRLIQLAAGAHRHLGTAVKLLAGVV